MLGSLIPSSTFLVNELLRRVDWKRANVIVEYGPGVGSFTTEVLRRMPPDATLVVLETNSDFVQWLKATYNDPRIKVMHRSAEDVDLVLRELGLPRADYVISGIPFSTMPDSLRESILRKTQSALVTDGSFLVYQFSGKVLIDLKKYFSRVDQGFEPLNILPARLFYCAR